ncbi:MAG: hypothetical protein ACJ8F7_01240 [Gemmataceae bacterium]
MEALLEKHSSEIMVLLLAVILMSTLLLVVPQLLRAHQRIQEERHAERMKSLEVGQEPPPIDERARAAGRTSALVPMVTVCAAATVTCFLVAFRSENTVSVSIAVWTVAGVVSLAAVMGGVALLGRLVQVGPDEEASEPKG